MILAEVWATNINTIILVTVIVGYASKTMLEMTGKTKSSKLIRDENKDLRERNATLEADKIERVANEVRMQVRIDALELRVKELESHDQSAVLHGLADHEVRAQTRAERAEATAGVRHEQALAAWERIAKATEAKLTT